MEFSKSFNYSEIARLSGVEKHKIITFKAGQSKSLSNDQIDSVINVIESESAKMVKALNKIKKQNESSK